LLNCGALKLETKLENIVVLQLPRRFGVVLFKGCVEAWFPAVVAAAVASLCSPSLQGLIKI
jgi:hypothetical protein